MRGMNTGARKITVPVGAVCCIIFTSCADPQDYGPEVWWIQVGCCIGASMLKPWVLVNGQGTGMGCVEVQGVGQTG